MSKTPKKSCGTSVARLTRKSPDHQHLFLSVDEAARLSIAIQSAVARQLRTARRGQEAEINLWLNAPESEATDGDRCSIVVY